MTSAFICDAVRTPIGRFGGGLAGVRTDDLAAIPIRALLARHPQLDPMAIDEMILGCANQAGEDNRNVARMAGLLAGLPASVPGVTVNRLCASGAEAIGSAARAISAGELDLIIAGGVENMTRSPFVMAKADKAWSRSAQLEDTTIGWRFVNPVMATRYGTDSMPATAENVATEHGIGRDDQDFYAAESQRRAARAQEQGFLAREIVPVQATSGCGEAYFDADEHLRPDTTIDALAKLKPLVRKDGTVTAGNSSGVNDGAAAMIVASEAATIRYELEPRARIVGMATAGVEPRVMGLGPVPAIGKLLARLRLKLDGVDHIELNEAFAVQVIACARGLGITEHDQRLNPNGGAIALGHPLGMSGARLIQTAVHALELSGDRRALIALCVGVGQGLAVMVERP